MRRIVVLFAASLALASSHVLAAAADAPGAAAATAPLGRLAWLGGCWIMETKERVVEEQWMAARGGSMLGVSRTVVLPQGALIEFEAMRIEERGYSLVLTSKPSGQAEGTFTSSSVTDSAVVFENPEHDFPTKIVYQRAADGGLTAWIEGPSKSGQPKRITFSYKRAACANAEAKR